MSNRKYEVMSEIVSRTVENIIDDLRKIDVDVLQYTPRNLLREAKQMFSEDELMGLKLIVIRTLEARFVSDEGDDEAAINQRIKLLLHNKGEDDESRTC